MPGDSGWQVVKVCGAATYSYRLHMESWVQAEIRQFPPQYCCVLDLLVDSIWQAVMQESLQTSNCHWGFPSLWRLVLEFLFSLWCHFKRCLISWFSLRSGIQYAIMAEGLQSAKLSSCCSRIIYCLGDITDRTGAQQQLLPEPSDTLLSSLHHRTHLHLNLPFFFLQTVLSRLPPCHPFYDAVCC